MQRPWVELEANNSEDDYRKKHQEADLQQRRHSLDDGLQYDLQTYTQNSFILSSCNKAQYCVNAL